MDIDRQTETPAAAYRGLVPLACATCGELVEAPLHGGWVRCLTCGALGHPDRAGRNLLPVGWDCPTCGGRNDGLTNFCVWCGAGLPSRCLHCEGPVYSAVCHRCGSHQGRLLRLMTVEAQRAEWVPILQSYANPASRSQPKISRPTAAGSSAERRTEERERRRADREARHQAMQTQRRPASGSWGWGLVWIGAGAILLVWQFRAQLSPIISQVRFSPQLRQGVDALQTWWIGLLPSIGSLATDSPQYAIFFASVVFGIAMLPVALYAINRLLHRLFP
jgi:hypothetical protein